jgi:general secretion pathway protein J
VVLQTGLAGMQVMGYQNDQWRPQLATNEIDQPQDPSGLQVGLVVPGQAAPMVKSFLLGGT